MAKTPPRRSAKAVSLTAPPNISATPIAASSKCASFGMSAIQAVMRGDDPPGILRDLNETEMLHFDVVGSGWLVNKGELVDHRPRVVRI